MKPGTIRLCPVLLSLHSPEGVPLPSRTMNRASIALLAAVVAFGQACHRGPVAPTGTGPAPVARPQAPPGAPSPTGQTLPVNYPLPPTLPSVPMVEGPLAPRVIYPRWDQMITSRDSNFIFGSIGNGLASLSINGQDVRVWPNGAFLGWVPNPPPAAAMFTLVARVGADSAVLTHLVRVAGMLPPVPDSLKPPPPVITDTTPTWVILRDTSLSLSDTDRVVIGRPTPASTYRWFLFPNTRALLTGRYPGFARVRLDSGLEIWVDAVDAKTFATDTTPPRRTAGNLRVKSAGDWVDVQFPIGERPAYLVEERDRSIELTLYGARGNTDLVSYPTSDSLVRHIEWAQELNDRVRYRVEMSSAPYGYLVLYESGVLTLRIRRPPSGRRSSVSGLRSVVRSAASNAPEMLVEPLASSRSRYCSPARMFSSVANENSSRNERTSVEKSISRKRSWLLSERSSSRPAAFACSILRPLIEPETSITSVTSRGSRALAMSVGGVTVMSAKPGSL